LRAAQGVLGSGPRMRGRRPPDRSPLPGQLLAGRRVRAHPEPDPCRRPADHRLPDGVDRPGRGSDRQQPFPARGYPLPGPRDRAPRGRRTGCDPAGGGRAAAGAAARGGAPPAMTACLFGTYDRTHSANRLLHLALAGAGFMVSECHEPLWEETADKGGRYFGPVSLGRLAGRYAQAARRLARRGRAVPKDPPPLVVGGFGGQLDVLLARRVCRPRAGLVFAPLVSLSETLVEDRSVFRARGLRARTLAALDRATLRAADLV